MRLWIALIASLLVAAPAYAHTTRIGDARDRASFHFKLGSAQYAAGKWSSALDEFEAGYAAHPMPAFLVNIGQCLRKLDRLDEAALAYRQFLDTRTGSPGTRLDVWDALEDVTAELNRRVDALAESAALFGAYMRQPGADPALVAKAEATREEILRTLVGIDDRLSRGYGVARALALPKPTPEATPEAMMVRVRQRLEAMAATRSPNATNANQRSARSMSHSHIRR
jgi:tetratricopeptide (TPR) repeat protein